MGEPDLPGRRVPKVTAQGRSRLTRWPWGRGIFVGVSAGVSSFFLVVIVALTLVFGYQGCDVLLDAHIVGYTTKYGNRVRFRDNGDRFLYAIGELIIAAAGAEGAWQLIQAGRREKIARRWSWEVTVDQQTIKRPPPSGENIQQDVDSFDGKLAACLLTDRDTGSRLWCHGDPERRVVEASLFGGDTQSTGVFARGDRTGAELVRLHAPALVDVPASVVLTGPEAREILLAFFRGRPFPPPFTLLPTTSFGGSSATLVQRTARGA